ncbi:MAG: flippase-like domain-containing protein, partial [Chloroflexi bacterium]|nr:flippase-like domain-containing protein [Chloroflexota bacterium]
TSRARPEAEEELPRIDLGRRLRSWQTLVGFLIGLLVFYFVFTGARIDFSQTWAAIRQANLGLYILGFLVYYAGFPVRGLRWRYMVRNALFGEGEAGLRLPLLRLTEILYLSWFANSVVPAKLGDLLRAYLLRRGLGVRIMKGMGTILAERIIDLSVLLALVALTGVVSLGTRLPVELGRALQIGFAIAVLTALGLASMRYLDRYIHRFIPERFRDMYRRFQEGVVRSFHLASLPFILGLTAVAWVTESLRLYFVVRSVGFHLSGNPWLELVMAAFVALAAAALTAVPLTPAGLGFVEGLIVTALLWLGAAANGLAITGDQAAAIALLDRSISYASLVILGAPVYVWAMRRPVVKALR